MTTNSQFAYVEYHVKLAFLFYAAWLSWALALIVGLIICGIVLWA